jgi:DNA-binding winged helix-turn-helix (wHTH) protein
MKRWTFFLFPILLLPLLAIYFNGQKNSSSYQESLEQVMLRKLVHQLMLSGGDTSSLILPVKQVDAGVFHLYPEKQLAINPDTFMAITSRLIQQYKGMGNFTAQIKHCDSVGVSYSFAVAEGELVATCSGRQLPKNCYYFEFVIAPAKARSGISNFWWYAILMALGAAIVVLVRKWAGSAAKNTPPKQQPLQTAESGQEIADSNALPLGRFLFHPERQWLMLGEEQITLTDKESKVLHLLAQRANNLVERSLLQQEVWENEGVIVTRSLDMFISKLRKKLADDPNIKILNIHGKGYKLLVDVV